MSLPTACSPPGARPSHSLTRAGGAKKVSAGRAILNLRQPDSLPIRRRRRTPVNSLIYRHDVLLTHSFRLRFMHKDSAPNCQAQRRAILQHHCRKKCWRALTRPTTMEANTTPDADAFPPTTAAQPTPVEGQ